MTDDLNTCFQKYLSYEAITELHRQLDGDRDGEVDRAETETFVRRQFSSSEMAGKPQSIAESDPNINTTELWAMWRKNPAFNWSNTDVLEWLEDVVGLPHYSPIFQRHAIDGKSIPLMAIQNMSYLTNVLMIRNPIDKRKLMLKSLDVILFGTPSGQVSRAKVKSLHPVWIGLISIGLTVMSHFVYRRLMRGRDGNHAAVSSGLASNEQLLIQLQSRLDELETLQRNVGACSGNSSGPVTSIDEQNLGPKPEWSLAEDSDPVFNTIDKSSSATTYCESTPTGRQFNNALSDANASNRSSTISLSTTNRALTSSHRNSSNNATSLSNWNTERMPSTESNGQLRECLNRTYDLELAYFCARRQRAVNKLSAARQACARFERKRYNMLGSLRLIHSDNLDDLQRRLCDIRASLEELQSEAQERQSRWVTIERLTGLSIIEHSRTSPENPNSAASDQISNLLHADFMNPISDSNVVEPDISNAARLNGHRDTSKSSSKTSLNLPRNYSFVRPFAMIWRRKSRPSAPSCKQRQSLI